jgi:hypothetical protein
MMVLRVYCALMSKLAVVGQAIDFVSTRARVFQYFGYKSRCFC